MTFDPDIGENTRLGPDWPGQRCGAKSKRTGKPCQGIAMANGRCHLHGGKSTGPRTKEGKDRLRIAATKHGMYAGPDHPIYGAMPGPKWRGYHGSGIRRMLGLSYRAREYARDERGRFVSRS